MSDDEFAELKPSYKAPPAKGWRGRWQWYFGQALGRGQQARWIVRVDRCVTLDQGRPELGIVGRTWIERGPDYWARRIAWAFVQFLLCVAFTGILTAALAALWQNSWPWPACAGITGVAGVATLAAFLPMWRRLEIDGFTPITQGRRRGGFGIGSMRILGPLLLLVVLPLLAGMLAAMFLSTLRRDFPGEGPARAALREYESMRSTRRRAKPH
ncbi:hypothetical protein ACWGCW_22315 [Streptomyces sp. NPDC054933]